MTGSSYGLGSKSGSLEHDSVPSRRSLDPVTQFVWKRIRTPSTRSTFSPSFHNFDSEKIGKESRREPPFVFPFTLEIIFKSGWESKEFK